MANYALIDGYLEALRLRVSWHRNVDDLVDEAEDHLYSSVQRLQADGLDIPSAEHITLQRFGDPQIVAAAFASTARGKLALPTSTTQRARTLAIIGAFLWPTVLAAWWIGGVIEPWGQVARNVTAVFWIVGWVAAMGAGVLMWMIVVALNQRHGGFELLGKAGVVCTGLAAIGTVAAWVFMVWGSLVMISMIMVGATLLRRRLVPRLPAAALAGGFVVGGVVWVYLRIANGSLLQWSEVYGSYWIANMTGLSVSLMIISFGLLGLGRWLRAEEPAQLEESDGVIFA